MKESPRKKEILVNGIVVGEYESTGDDDKDILIVQGYLKDKGLWRKIELEEMMFRQAQSFASTANNLYKNDIRKQPRNFYSLAPFVVNAAFSIEIYLKTLHTLYGNRKGGHSLFGLYKSLNKKGKTHINKIADETKHLYKIEKDRDFEKCLNHLDKAFVQWRYLYEDNAEKIEFMPTLFVMQVLDKACILVKYEKEHNKANSVDAKKRRN